MLQYSGGHLSSVLGGVVLQVDEAAIFSTQALLGQDLMTEEHAGSVMSPVLLQIGPQLPLSRLPARRRGEPAQRDSRAEAD